MNKLREIIKIEKYNVVRIRANGRKRLKGQLEIDHLAALDDARSYWNGEIRRNIEREKELLAVKNDHERDLLKKFLRNFKL